MSRDRDDARTRVNAAASREAAHACLDGAQLNKDELIALAADLGVTLTKRTVADIKREIVEDTVGVRLDRAAIRGRSWDRR